MVAIENNLTLELVGYEYICPKCGESDARKMETANGLVISCNCNFVRVLPGCECPNCGEIDMDKIIAPDEDEVCECMTCGTRYTIPK